jgi:hypothetical protein
VIASGVDPYDTTEPLHLAYDRWNRERGRMGGQIRMRVRHEALVGPRFDHLFLSRPARPARPALAALVEGAGWRIARLIGAGATYAAALDRDV